MQTDPYQAYLERLQLVHALLESYMPDQDRQEYIRRIKFLLESEDKWTNDRLAWHLAATQRFTEVPVQVFRQVVDCVEIATLAYMYAKDENDKSRD